MVSQAALSLILMLDYSGSMEQPLDKTPKIQIVQKQVHALLSSVPPQASSEAIVFGTKPEKECKDVRMMNGKNATLQKQILDMKPGAFGKTPLTHGFRALVSRLQKYPGTRAVVITDGADTCGENPCEFLKQVDSKIKTEKPYEIFMVGLDLKEDKSQMQCFKDLELKNFKITFADIDSKEDLLNQLKASQSLNKDIETEIKDSMRTGNTGIKIFKMKGQNKAGGSRSSNNKDLKPPAPPAHLEITGAPEDARFSISGEKHSQTWEGPFTISVPPGEYKIRFEDANNGTEITFKLAQGTLTKIPWAQLMKNAVGAVDMNEMALTLKWTPENSTKEIHGDIKPIETLARLDNKTVAPPNIPFGKWNIEVISPPWLAKRMKPRSVVIANGTRNKINITELFGDELKWVDAPQTAGPQVMVIQNKDLQEERHFLPAGQFRHIPMLKDSEANWLSPEPPTKN
ncbi:VWA domain-containing protein [Bdellovibrio sp. SKB1291214]|uniref:vWA domain-containing protein n=1 Tax=Bdellovibrio sp. SKB1291214 TaxID=1732569 RepID=UPI000B515764|nr:VWA domain-containing protein [Bdellovibrio sp. SKB1291214]UYL07590.1 VWA domain-containing protein [Bdellovibrio sp. SKB1291214]